MAFDLNDWVVCGLEEGSPYVTEYYDVGRYCSVFEENFEIHQRLLAELKALQAYQESFMNYEDGKNLQEYFDSFCQTQTLKERLLKCEMEILRTMSIPVIEQMQLYFVKRIFTLEMWLKRVVCLNRDCLSRQVVLKAGITRNRLMLDYLQHLAQCSRLTQYRMETETQLRIPSSPPERMMEELVWSDWKNGTNSHNQRWPRTFWEHLRPTTVLSRHSGCVNSVSWHESGSALVTGSDDLHLALWSYPSGRCLAYQMTAHTDNIFASTWLPGSSKVATIGRDGNVGVYDCGSGRVVEDRWFSCHSGGGMRLTTEPGNGSVFWTCSRDGTVRQYDLREPSHNCEGECNNALVSAMHEQIGFNSISMCQVNPNYFAVGGQEPTVLIYDRRNLSLGTEANAQANLEKTTWKWFPNPGECGDQQISSVCFAPSSTALAVSFHGARIYLTDPLDQSHYDKHKYRESPTGIFSEAFKTEFDVYRLVSSDRRQPHHQMDHMSLHAAFTRLSKLHVSLGRTPAWKTIAAYELCNAAIAKIFVGSTLNEDLRAVLHVKDKAKNMLGDPHDPLVTMVTFFAFLTHRKMRSAKQILDSGIQWPGCEGARRLLDLDLHVADSEWMRMLFDHEDFNLCYFDIMASEAWKALAQPGHLLGYQSAYSGHANEVTVKDVSFAGSHGEFVASGSDKGFFFLWDRESMEPVFLGHGDRDIVNVVQCHPILPVLATSGIDSDVKLWEPRFSDSEAEFMDVPDYVYPLSRTEYASVMEKLKRREHGFAVVLGGANIPVGCAMQ